MRLVAATFEHRADRASVLDRLAADDRRERELAYAEVGRRVTTFDACVIAEFDRQRLAVQRDFVEAESVHDQRTFATEQAQRVGDETAQARIVHADEHYRRCGGI